MSCSPSLSITHPSKRLKLSSSPLSTLPPLPSPPMHISLSLSRQNSSCRGAAVGSRPDSRCSSPGSLSPSAPHPCSPSYLSLSPPHEPVDWPVYATAAAASCTMSRSSSMSQTPAASQRLHADHPVPCGHSLSIPFSSSSALSLSASSGQANAVSAVAPVDFHATLSLAPSFSQAALSLGPTCTQASIPLSTSTSQSSHISPSFLGALVLPSIMCEQMCTPALSADVQASLPAPIAMERRMTAHVQQQQPDDDKKGQVDSEQQHNVTITLDNKPTHLPSHPYTIWLDSIEKLLAGNRLTLYSRMQLLNLHYLLVHNILSSTAIPVPMPACCGPTISTTHSQSQSQAIHARVGVQDREQSVTVLPCVWQLARHGVRCHVHESAQRARHVQFRPVNTGIYKIDGNGEQQQDKEVQVKEEMEEEEKEQEKEEETYTPLTPPNVYSFSPLSLPISSSILPRYSYGHIGTTTTTTATATHVHAAHATHTEHDHRLPFHPAVPILPIPLMTESQISI